MNLLISESSVVAVTPPRIWGIFGKMQEYVDVSLAVGKLRAAAVCS